MMVLLARKVRKSGMVIICPALFGRGLRAGASYAVASGSRVGTPFAAPLKKGPSTRKGQRTENKGNRGGFGLTARC